jgi:hypothetical protein
MAKGSKITLMIVEYKTFIRQKQFILPHRMKMTKPYLVSMPFATYSLFRYGVSYGRYSAMLVPSCKLKNTSKSSREVCKRIPQCARSRNMGLVN